MTWLNTEIINLEAILFVAGIATLVVWLVKTRFGSSALADSVPRPCSMPLYLPVVPLGVWFLVLLGAVQATESFFGDLEGWRKALADNSAMAVAAIATSLLILFMARVYFAGGVKGLGLNAATAWRDLSAAILNLLCAWPLVTLAVILTLTTARFLGPDDFQMPRHQELELLLTYDSPLLRIMIVLTTVVIIPVFEEILFRGLFQTAIRSHIIRPWPSIALSSVIFAAVHPNASHWPALFILAACLGYAYEKSGSLLRPIFIHAIFNASSILATLYGVGQ